MDLEENGKNKYKDKKKRQTTHAPDQPDYHPCVSGRRRFLRLHLVACASHRRQTAIRASHIVAIGLPPA